jgi:hypothetical protein
VRLPRALAAKSSAESCGMPLAAILNRHHIEKVNNPLQALAFESVVYMLSLDVCGSVFGIPNSCNPIVDNLFQQQRLRRLSPPSNRIALQKAPSMHECSSTRQEFVILLLSSLTQTNPRLTVPPFATSAFLVFRNALLKIAALPDSSC